MEKPINDWVTGQLDGLKQWTVKAIKGEIDLAKREVRIEAEKELLTETAQLVLSRLAVLDKPNEGKYLSMLAHLKGVQG